MRMGARATPVTRLPLHPPSAIRHHCMPTAHAGRSRYNVVKCFKTVISLSASSKIDRRPTLSCREFALVSARARSRALAKHLCVMDFVFFFAMEFIHSGACLVSTKQA